MKFALFVTKKWAGFIAERLVGGVFELAYDLILDLVLPVWDVVSFPVRFIRTTEKIMKGEKQK